MEGRRDRYLNNLIDRMHNGMIKVITGVRRCGKTYLLFELFGNYLRDELRVGDDHIVEVALDEEANRGLRDPGALDSYLKSRIVNKTSRYYVMLDEVQYAISDEELRGARTSSPLWCAQRPAAHAKCRRLCDRQQLQTAVL